MGSNTKENDPSVPKSGGAFSFSGPTTTLCQFGIRGVRSCFFFFVYSVGYEILEAREGLFINACRVFVAFAIESVFFLFFTICWT
jgi:hypothetical protein